MEQKEDENKKKDDDEWVQELEQETCCDGRRVFKYQGLWCSINYLQSLLSFKKYFKSQPLDAVLATSPKCGTTWLKALAFAIATRNIISIDQSPLLTSNPHELVPFLEIGFSWEKEDRDLQNMHGPRIFSNHMFFEMLPQTMVESDCKIIYICRNPLDQFVSFYYFLLDNGVVKDVGALEFDEAVDKFCKGIHPQGPFWDHMLGYWNAHLKNPRKVLFLKYEDLKDDIAFNVRKMAEFLGFPFSFEEEKQGLIEQISSLCSFDNLKNLEVNKNGKVYGMLEKRSFFRKGEIGDWKNHLTPAMAECLKKIMESKLKGSGLTFKTQNEIIC